MMRRVGIKQLKDEAPALLAGGETLVIERRGTPVAVVVPLEAIDRQQKARALADFGAAIRAFLAAHDLDEAEFETEIVSDASGC
jgi:antitoxin (DNA-binding transcriptional repressor) of toxin-antitoxin stability system